MEESNPAVGFSPLGRDRNCFVVTVTFVPGTNTFSTAFCPEEAFDRTLLGSSPALFPLIT